MIKQVKKRDGSIEPFNGDKLHHWAEFAAKEDVDWLQLLVKTMQKLGDDPVVSSEEIHNAMIDVCTDEGTTRHLSVAARLTRGDIYRQVYGSSQPEPFSVSYKRLVEMGKWKDFNISESDLATLDKEFTPANDKYLEFASLCQFVDKYLMKKDGVLVETPSLAQMGIALDTFYEQDGLAHAIEYSHIIAARK